MVSGLQFIELAVDVGRPGALVAEQQFVIALVGMSPDVGAGFEHLQAR